MKKILLIISVCFCASLFSQNAVKFSHDAGGNMTKRYTRQLNLRIGQTLKADSSLSFKVYPNPTKDYVTIEGSLNTDEKEAEVSFYDVTGSLLKQDKYFGDKKTFQLSGYANGIYFLELKYASKKSVNYRLVIAQ